MKSFGAVTLAQAALRGEDDLSDFSLPFRIALDCMPEPRRSTFLVAVKKTERGDAFRVEDLEGESFSRSTAYETVEDLKALDVLTQVGKGRTSSGRAPVLYGLSETLQRRLELSGLADWLRLRWRIRPKRVHFDIVPSDTAA